MLKSKKRLYAAIAIGVVLVIIIVVIGIPKTTDIVPGGTVESIPAGEYYLVEFNTTGFGKLAVSVNATDGITFYLVPSSKYSTDLSSRSWSYYWFTSGHISGGSFSTYIVSGTWYAVFYNSNIITASTVTINSMTFTLQPVIFTAFLFC